jgi:hypothetical protein
MPSTPPTDCPYVEPGQVSTVGPIEIDEAESKFAGDRRRAGSSSAGTRMGPGWIWNFAVWPMVAASARLIGKSSRQWGVLDGGAQAPAYRPSLHEIFGCKARG